MEVVIKIEVKDNNVEQALRVLKRKLQRDGFFKIIKLKNTYDIPYSEGSMHEFVISAVSQKNRGVKALDIAKSLLDYDYHSPTIYFPINVQEAIMIEPTESETLDTLDAFADSMIEIDKSDFKLFSLVATDIPAHPPPIIKIFE